MTDTMQSISCRGVAFPHDASVITPRIARKLQKGFYETDEITILADLLSPGARVLELGGGLGFVSSYALLHCAAAHVTSVEANPVLCAYMRRVHRANGISGAEVIHGAPRPRTAPEPANGMLPFHVTDPFWSSSLSEPSAATQSRINVPALRLDDLVQDCRPDVMICDIEGGEADLFGDASLDDVTHVIMELHTRVYGGEGIRRTFDSMHRQGFYYHQKLSQGDIVVFERLKSPPHQSGSTSPASRMA